MTSHWLKSNAVQLLSMLVMAAMVVGQWQERSAGASVRLERLENLASQERVRLDSIYLRREMSDEQLRAIVYRIGEVDKRLERIEAATVMRASTLASP